jgi:hypothetical protein
MRLLVVLLVTLGVGCDSSSSGPPTQTQILAACGNVCGCFSSASSVNSCRSDCTRMKVNGAVKVGQAFSGASASYYGNVFWTSSGSVGGNKSGLVTSGCLDCLSHASCTDLEKGNACLSQCQPLIPKHS